MRAIISNHAVLLGTTLMLGLCACTTQIISGVGSGSGGGGSGGGGSSTVSSTATSLQTTVSTTATGQGGSVTSGSVTSGGMTGPGVSCSQAPPVNAPPGTKYEFCGGNAAVSSGQPFYCEFALCSSSGQKFLADCTATGCSCLLDDQVYCDCVFQAPASGCSGGSGCCPAPWPVP